MKYFTPDLIERFGSEDDAVALAAQEELEQRSEAYAQALRGIEPQLPPRLREMQQRFYLHDARVMTPLVPGRTDLAGPVGPEMVGIPITPTAAEPRRWPAFSIMLHLDAPPREFLVLHYRWAMVEEVRRFWLPRDEVCPYLEWQYDEVELAESGQGIEFSHSILFTNGFELRLRFADFDFATLKPLAAPAEAAPAGRRTG
jgi:hypothetical protein